ncbi:MAG: RNA methyltransferase [Bacteroidota bacterium]|nr:RNA methyltransferase [Bacteroidota bacterium]
MISKSKIKLIKSLGQKKFRDETGLFMAEGTKLVLDLLPAFHCPLLAATPGWLSENRQVKADEIIEVDATELNKLSNQKSQQGVVAVFTKPRFTWKAEELNRKLSLALDDVQDPGNLGTILRAADWFGITDVFCSEHSADAFNPKTVQATMGALARVKVHTVDLVAFLQSGNWKMPIYGTFMDGEIIYDKPLSQHGIIVMGNEGNGISPDIERLVTERLLIPNYPIGQATSESLNVGIATALVCSEFRRRLQ